MPRFTGGGHVDGTVYAVPKNWGTTGYAVNTEQDHQAHDDLEGLLGHRHDGGRTGRTMVHDYQLTTIGNALKYYGYSFNSIKPKELAKAEELLIKVKPHLFAIIQRLPAGDAGGDAWMAMCWTNDAAQLHRDLPEIVYVLGKEGGEIWTDFYAIPKDAPNKPAGYALLNYFMTPEIAVKEHLAHGAPATDARVNKLLPQGGPGQPDPIPGGATCWRPWSSARRRR